MLHRVRQERDLMPRRDRPARPSALLGVGPSVNPADIDAADSGDELGTPNLLDNVSGDVRHAPILRETQDLRKNQVAFFARDILCEFRNVLAAMPTDWKEKISKGLEKPGKTQAGLAQALGVDPAAVSRLLIGKRQLKAAEIPKVEAYLELEREAGRVEPNARPAAAINLFGEANLPIYASAQGGGTGMTISYDPIEYVVRPSPLVGVKNAFGFYVIGESMEPMYKPGWIVLVHPTRPPLRGDAVLVTLKSDDQMSHDALVKIFEGWKDEKLMLSQLNPVEKLRGIPRDRVESVQLIVGSYVGR